VGIPIDLSLLMIVYVLVSVDTNIDACQYEGMDQLACCQPLAHAPLSADGAQQLAGVLKALADPARLRLLSLIQAREGAEACVCHLTEPLGLTQPTVSHHLKVLHEAGLLARERRGVWVYYRVVPEALRTVADLITVPIPATAA
jgi:ArsR family transcriptional regulator, arsenate/arsenite/antimonite-responsive transcriptional repressor